MRNSLKVDDIDKCDELIKDIEKSDFSHILNENEQLLSTIMLACIRQRYFNRAIISYNLFVRKDYKIGKDV